MEILRPLRLRYFSPEELLRLFCFEDVGTSDRTFRWPEGVSTKTKYRLIGNSVNVLVVSTLIECLCQSYGMRLISLSPGPLSRPQFRRFPASLQTQISEYYSEASTLFRFNCVLLTPTCRTTSVQLASHTTRFLEMFRHSPHQHDLVS